MGCDGVPRCSVRYRRLRVLKCGVHTEQVVYEVRWFGFRLQSTGASLLQNNITASMYQDYIQGYLCIHSTLTAYLQPPATLCR